MPPRNRLFLRRAKAVDVVDLWRWRNDKESRLNSLTRKKISFKEHETWFANILMDSRRQIYVATKNGAKIGMARFDFSGKDLIEVSLNMNPAYRGKGLGKQLLKKVSNLMKQKYTRRWQKAIIRTSNLASEKIFSAAGFSKIHEVKELGYSVWIRN